MMKNIILFGAGKHGKQLLDQYGEKYLLALLTTWRLTAVSFIVAFAAGIVGGLIALFMIFAIFMEAKNLIKGEGSASIWKLLGKVLVFILMIGLVYVAIGYTSLGQSAKDVADKGVGAVISTVPDALK